MFKIRHATEAFAALDNDHDKKTLDQALRHLSQRVYFPAAGRSGRADLYPLHGICALRLMHKASAFGFDRSSVDRLAQWLLNEPTGPARRKKVDGGYRALCPTEEAIERVREGQDFNFVVSFRRGGFSVIFPDWASDDAPSADVVEAIFANVGMNKERADEHLRLTIPASALIAELLPVLENASD